MIDKEAIKLYSEKKSKNFGYTFSVIFLILTIYDYINYYNYFLIYLSLTLFLLFCSIFKPVFLAFPSHVWDRFGIFLGILFSPIILSLIYMITIIPISIILNIFKIELLGKKFQLNISSYWEERKNNNINFKNQF